jgi:hypothetical protein
MIVAFRLEFRLAVLMRDDGERRTHQHGGVSSRAVAALEIVRAGSFAQA